MLATTASPTLPSIAAPVIFLPGTLCDERIWMPVWQAMNLQQRSFVPLQWAESMEHMLALTADRLNSFDEPVHLVGFSMGAYVAALAALNKGTSANIASISFVGYSPFGLSDTETKARQQMLKLLKQKKLKGLDSSRLAQYFTADELSQTSMLQPILDMEGDLGNSVLYAHVSSTTPREDLSNKLTKLAVKQHWICAQHDKIAPAKHVKQYCLRTKQTTFKEFENTAHIMPLTRSAELAAYLTQCILELR